VRYHLKALSSHETAHYIRHRLKISGATRCPHFTRLALWRVQTYSQGVPRLVNALCDKALLAGFVNRRQEIDYRTIGVAIQELEGTF
jgi:general secretion pathway protein A